MTGGEGSAATVGTDATGPRRRTRGAWLRRLWGMSTGRFGLIVVAVVVVTAAVSLVCRAFDDGLQ